MSSHNTLFDNIFPCNPFSVRLSSIGDDENLYEDVIRNCASSASDSEEDEEVSVVNVSGVETMDRDDLMLHLRHMEAREQLQMFPGRVPPPKKAVRRKRETQSSSSGTSDDRSRISGSSNIRNNVKISMKDHKPKEKSKVRLMFYEYA